MAPIDAGGITAARDIQSAVTSSQIMAAAEVAAAVGQRQVQTNGLTPWTTKARMQAGCIVLIKVKEPGEIRTHTGKDELGYVRNRYSARSLPESLSCPR